MKFILYQGHQTDLEVGEGGFLQVDKTASTQVKPWTKTGLCG